jgi:hypothetical protein
MIRQSKCVISGTGRNHPRLLQLLLSHNTQQGQYGIPGPPFFEGARELLKFRLEKYVGPKQFG